MCVYVQFRLTTNRRVAPRRRSGYAKSHNTHTSGPFRCQTEWIIRYGFLEFRAVFFLLLYFRREFHANGHEIRPSSAHVIQISRRTTHTHTVVRRTHTLHGRHFSPPHIENDFAKFRSIIIFPAIRFVTVTARSFINVVHESRFDRRSRLIPFIIQVHRNCIHSNIFTYSAVLSARNVISRLLLKIPIIHFTVMKSLSRIFHATNR